jgi:hypothetical protein
VAAEKGADALRVLAIDTLAEKAHKPACVVNPHAKGPKYLKRCTGWQQRVMDLARETYKEAVKRAEWVLARRADFGLIAAACNPSAPAPSAPVALGLLKASEAAWTLIKTNVCSGMSVDALRSLILDDLSGASAVAVLFKIQERQTPQERACGAVIEANGVGFSGVDSEFAGSLLRQVRERKSLSPKQTSCAIKIAKKYARQAHESAQS